MSNMLRKALTGIAVAAAFITTSVAASAQETGKLEEVLARGHLIVGTGSTNAPWHFKDESGNLVLSRRAVLEREKEEAKYARHGPR